VSEIGKGVRLHRSASGEWEAERENSEQGVSLVKGVSLSPEHSGTLIGVEIGPERAIPSEGFAPVVANEAWEPVDHSMPYWCIRRGGIWPRVHQPEHFLLFDPALPAYRRCPRCGWTVYTGVGRG